MNAFIDSHKNLQQDLLFVLYLMLKVKEYDNYTRKTKDADLSWVTSLQKVLEYCRKAHNVSYDKLDVLLYLRFNRSMMTHFQMSEPSLCLSQDLAFFILMNAISPTLKKEIRGNSEWSTPSRWYHLWHSSKPIDPSHILGALREVSEEAWTATKIRGWALLEPFVSTIPRSYDLPLLLDFVANWTYLDWGNYDQISNFSKCIVGKNFIEEPQKIKILLHFADNYSRHHPTLNIERIEEEVLRPLVDGISRQHHMSFAQYRKDYPRVARVLTATTLRNLSSLSVDRFVHLIDEGMIDTGQWDSKTKLERLLDFCKKPYKNAEVIIEFQKLFTALTPTQEFVDKSEYDVISLMLVPLRAMVDSYSPPTGSSDRIALSVQMITFILCIPSYANLFVRALLAKPKRAPKKKKNKPVPKSFIETQIGSDNAGKGKEKEEEKEKKEKEKIQISGKSSESDGEKVEEATNCDLSKLAHLIDDKKRALQGIVKVWGRNLPHTIRYELLVQLSEEERTKCSQLHLDQDMPTVKLYETLIDLFCESMPVDGVGKWVQLITQECPSQPKQSYLVYELMRKETESIAGRCVVSNFFFSLYN